MEQGGSQGAEGGALGEEHVQPIPRARADVEVVEGRFRPIQAEFGPMQLRAQMAAHAGAGEDLVTEGADAGRTSPGHGPLKVEREKKMSKKTIYEDKVLRREIEMKAANDFEEKLSADEISMCMLTMERKRVSFLADQLWLNRRVGE